MKVTYGAIVQRASGRFGGTVHTNWKGIDVVRRFAKPSNPNTGFQQTVRAQFTALTLMYTLQPTNVRAAWVAFAVGKPFIPRNAWIGKNQSSLVGDGTTAAMTMTPGDSSTIPPVSVVVTPGATDLSCAVTAPAAPSGWTLTSAIACAIPTNSLDTIVGDLTAHTIVEASDVTNPYVCDITGLVNGVPYDVFVFLKWTAPDLSVRYSASIHSTGTPT